MSHFVSIFLLRVLYFNLITICSIFSVINKKEIYFTITYNLFLDINNIAILFLLLFEPVLSYFSLQICIRKWLITLTLT